AQRALEARAQFRKAQIAAARVRHRILSLPQRVRGCCNHRSNPESAPPQARMSFVLVPVLARMKPAHVHIEAQTQAGPWYGLQQGVQISSWLDSYGQLTPAQGT